MWLVREALGTLRVMLRFNWCRDALIDAGGLLIVLKLCLDGSMGGAEGRSGGPTICLDGSMGAAPPPPLSLTYFDATGGRSGGMSGTHHGTHLAAFTDNVTCFVEAIADFLKTLCHLCGRSHLVHAALTQLLTPGMHTLLLADPRRFLSTFRAPAETPAATPTGSMSSTRPSSVPSSVPSSIVWGHSTRAVLSDVLGAEMARLDQEGRGATRRSRHQCGTSVGSWPETPGNIYIHFWSATSRNV